VAEAIESIKKVEDALPAFGQGLTEIGAFGTETINEAALKKFLTEMIS